MVDPGTIDAIASLAERTFSVLKAVTCYVQDVRHAPDVILQMSAQVTTWSLQLESLRLLLEQGELPDHVNRVLQSESVLGDAQDCLIQLAEILAQAPRPRQQPGLSLQDLWDRARWPVTSKDKTKDILERLDRHRQEIQLALQTTNT